MHQPDPHRLPCGFDEERLIAAALGELSQAESREAVAHAARCPGCHILVERYRSIRSHLGALSAGTGDAAGLALARRRLDARLAAHLRPRLQLEVWHAPIGDLRIGRTEKGVALVEFARPGGGAASPSHWHGRFAVERGGREDRSLRAALDAYFRGDARSLGWTVDDALMRSDFQRAVLRATAEVPYGTVVTYRGIAEAIGQPTAVRAVAQALRHNPVPIRIPCHRVIGSDGTLVGYAGNLVGIKRRILEVEGIPVIETRKGLAISRPHVYVGWRHDHFYCRPRCTTLKDQRAGDRSYIASRAVALELGYQPCDVCRPDGSPAPH